VTTDTAGVEVAGDLDSKPQIALPGGNPPDTLVTADLVEGDGAAARPGGQVTAHYVGVSWSSGTQFDASWDRGTPIAFPLDGVIQGWSQGLPGMKVGGRRLLVIPPELAYGRRPPPGAGIAPGETLVFVVDLIKAA
jgi:peptidylprolyl isomerase